MNRLSNLSFFSKLWLSALSIILGTTLLFFLYHRATIAQERARYAENERANSIEAEMITYYQMNGSLNGFVEAFARRLRPPGSEGERLPPLLRGTRLIDANGIALTNFDGYEAGDQVGNEISSRARPITDKDVIIGYIDITIDESSLVPRPLDAGIITTILQLILMASVITLLIAAALSYRLSKWLTQPIVSLTQFSEQIAQGDLSTSLPVNSQDEIGQLTETYNRMAANLSVATDSRKSMIAKIAHDLGNPLQVVYGYIGAMRDGILELTPERFETVVIEMERLERMINDINLLAQADAQNIELNIEKVEVGPLLKHMVESYRPLAHEAQIDIFYRQSGNQALNICADHARLIQVLGNLLNNGLRYTPQGGTIILNAVVENDDVMLAVRDSGPGISPEHLPYIFEQFYQVGKADPNTKKGKMGLGLAISKALIEAMGGRISVISNEGFQGTEFRIHLKIAG